MRNVAAAAEPEASFCSEHAIGYANVWAKHVNTMYEEAGECVLGAEHTERP